MEAEAESITDSFPLLLLNHEQQSLKRAGCPRLAGITEEIPTRAAGRSGCNWWKLGGLCFL